MKKLRRKLARLRHRRQLAKHAKLRAAKNHDNATRIRKRKAEKRLTRAIASVKLAISKILEDRPPQFETWMLNGKSGDVTDEVKTVIAWAVGKFSMVVTSTTGDTHSPTSWHYKGMAVDLWHSSVSTMIAFQRFILEELGQDAFNELFGPDAFYIKNGARVNAPFPDHGDHDHVAPR